MCWESILKNNGRLVLINGIEVTITDVDYDYTNTSASGSAGSGKFNITFNVTVNNKVFVIHFSNERSSSESSYLADTFIGNGDSYSSFLTEAESNSQLRDATTFSDETNNAANKVIGAVAQSFYDDVRSHSSDQDEE